MRSELRVTRPGGVPLVAERFALEPGKQDPFGCGTFGDFRSLLSVWFIGARAEALAGSLEADLVALNKPGAAWIGAGRREGAGFLVRGMGADRRDLQPVHDMIFAALADAAWLGFNPWQRRW